MFSRLILESFLRQRRRKILAALAIVLGTTAVTAMLAIATSVGDKMAVEMSAYGANIVVYPAADALDVEIGGVNVRPVAVGSYLQENDLAKIKNIFWRNNVADISPELPLTASLSSSHGTLEVPATGYWFHHTLRSTDPSSGESWIMGAPSLHPWWKLLGAWPRERTDEIAVGAQLAHQLRLKIGDKVVAQNQPVRVVGIVSSGDATDRTLLIPLRLAQRWVGHPGAVRRVYVGALTKPEDALARRNPDKLSPKLRDRWYCSPYANSIAYQIQEVLPNTRAEQIRRIAQGEGTILSRISGLMLLVAFAALVAAGLAVGASMTTAIVERRQEIGLMRALGATRVTIAGLFFTEITLLALAGGIAGYLLGSVLALRISDQVFGSPISFNATLLPAALLLALGVSFAGSAPSIWQATQMEPATILREEG
ncbi:MAG TPA: ABC transporter permease [Acidobacteriaceae bacterium]|nr:ABC transporter permease [Acidobacteriaceae bacterium]